MENRESSGLFQNGYFLPLLQPFAGGKREFSSDLHSVNLLEHLDVKPRQVPLPKTPHFLSF